MKFGKPCPLVIDRNGQDVLHPRFDDLTKKLWKKYNNNEKGMDRASCAKYVQDCTGGNHRIDIDDHNVDMFFDNYCVSSDDLV